MKQFALLWLCSFACGCVVGPDYQRPEDPAIGEQFQQAEVAGVFMEEPLPEWWRGFSDPILEGLVMEALAENKSIDASLARLNRARAYFRESQLGLLPTILADGGYEKSQLSSIRTPGVTSDNQELELYDAGFDALWELDFFGRIRREIQARSALHDGAMASLENVQQSVVSELTRSYIELRGFQEKLRITQENVVNQEKSHALTRSLFEAGSVTELDVSQASTLLEQTRSAIPVFESLIAARIYQIAVLIGQTPEISLANLDSPKGLPSYQVKMNIGNPTEMLRRRPDIRAAERNLASSMARVGVRMGDLFPKVQLIGSLAIEAEEFSNMTAGGSEVYSFGPRISWEALNINRVLTQIAQARADADENLALYEEAVLSALKEVEISLSQFGSEQKHRAILASAVASSRRAVELAELQYQNGLVDYVSVLNATRAVLVVELEYVNSETDCITALIAVFKALGAPVMTGESQTSSS